MPDIQPLAHLTPETTALFLDFDGTLAEIVARPEEARVTPEVLAGLHRLFDVLDGALAIITGRDIASIDLLLAPHVLPVSGVHGFEMRAPSGEIDTLDVDYSALATVERELRSFADQNPGLLIESKPASVALHYRARPELEQSSLQVAERAIPEGARLKLLRGKMVVEIKAHAGNKGTAVESFMRLRPFAGRVPVFIGDDTTDEAAFVEINRRHGVSIKVGEGATAATHRIADTAAVARLVADLVARFARDEVSGELAT
ncbi:MAG: trehalose-phosphatase [Hyphomicrobiaceae bacterium]